MRLKQTTATAILILFAFSSSSCGNGGKGKYENSQDMMYEMVNMDENREDALRVSKTEEENHTILFSPPEVRDEYITDEENIGFGTSKAAMITHDGDKKFIRTSQLQFSVKDVVKATHAIEDIVIAKEGFIIKSTLSNSVTDSKEVKVSKDSTLQRSYSHLRGNLTLRVRHELLNQTLKEIALVAQRMEYRNVEADDITFKILANELKQSRKKDKASRVKAITGAGKGHKLEDMLTVEDDIDMARLQADEALIEEKIMYDNVKYSTITISLGQDPIVVDKMIVYPTEIEQYHSSFFENVADGLIVGWLGILAVIESLVYIWPITLLLAVGVFLIVRKMRKKKEDNIAN